MVLRDGWRGIHRKVDRVGRVLRGPSDTCSASFAGHRRARLPTCLTLGSGARWSAAAKLLGRRLIVGIARRLPVARRRGWLVLGSRPAVENGARSDSKEVWEQSPKSECPSRTPTSERAPTGTEVRARMKVLIGVDPHKASVAVAVVDEATGELVERASFPQNRDGLRALENALGDTVPRASLGGGERWRPRSVPGREVGGGPRVGGGRAALAFGTGASALDRQRPQKRWARCPRHRASRLAQWAAGHGRSRGHL